MLRTRKQMDKQAKSYKLVSQISRFDAARLLLLGIICHLPSANYDEKLNSRV